MPLPRISGLAAAALVLCAPCPAAARCGPSGGAVQRAADAAPSAPAAPLPRAPKIPRAPQKTAPDDDGPVTAGAPSGEAARARSLYEAGRWAEAAPVLARVADGETGDDAGNRQIARFRLGVALYRLRLHHGSLEVFGAVADAPDHYGFSEALHWLAAIDAELPEPAGVVDHLGKHAARAPGPLRASNRARIHHLLGLRAYRDRHYEEAARELEQVARESDLYPRAQFMLGMSYVVLRKAVLAVKAFARVVEAVGAETPGDEAMHLRNLAWISMARAYYSASVHLDEICAPTTDTNKLSASVKYWGRIEMDSDLWPDARLEESWAYFIAGDYPHALGSLHNLESGYFAASLYPEADIVRGIVAFTTCRYDDAITIVGRMHKRYGPIRRELTALLARLSKRRDEDVLAFHAEVRAGRASAPAILWPFLEATIPDRPIRRDIDHLASVVAEEARLQAMPEALRASKLGEDLAAGLSAARAAAVHGAAARVRTLLQRRIDEIDAQFLDATKLLVDVHAAQLNVAREPRRRAPEAFTTGIPAPDVEHVIWPFDGEFWRDELGSYRQRVVSWCGAR